MHQLWVQTTTYKSPPTSYEKISLWLIKTSASEQEILYSVYTGICDEFCTQETPEKNVNSQSARVEVVFNKVILPLHMVGPL